MKNPKLRLLPTLVLLLLASWAGAYAQITPSQDAFTNTASPTTNSGANVLLNVNGATEISYIQFNLASIPSGASVSQATLKLYVTRSPQRAVSMWILSMAAGWRARSLLAFPQSWGLRLLRACRLPQRQRTSTS